MDNVKKINDEISVAMEQITPEQLQSAAKAGYRSVLNLRSPEEEGYLNEEETEAGVAGLHYANIPVKPNAMSTELVDHICTQIDLLAKPVLTHCKTGMRSGAIALMYIATREGMSAEAAMEKGKELGFNCDASPQMKQFFQNYLSEE
ncbi:MAG: sulfur transferase domain-containing protein [Oscillatoria sp. PMC 1068.18]|nr:sulfur transferase domain-containing protein [Oscillatoria sp. PMC 1076.18]MEC4987313.1 sulfur transferase domain-containing protein [Oscillatoria sp. PMC 1068.18]